MGVGRCLAVSKGANGCGGLGGEGGGAGSEGKERGGSVEGIECANVYLWTALGVYLCVRVCVSVCV